VQLRNPYKPQDRIKTTVFPPLRTGAFTVNFDRNTRTAAIHPSSPQKGRLRSAETASLPYETL